MPWVSASIPVAAVIGFGNPTIRQASSATAAGWIDDPEMISFLCVDWLVMTAPIVASLPVPEVVGITNKGAASSGALPKPAQVVMSSPALCLVKAMTFAQSMDEPPPTAIIAVAPDSRRIRAPAST